MSAEPDHALDLKRISVAAVAYAVRFDPQGKPTTVGSIHIDQAGRVQFSGDPARSLEILLTATRKTMKTLVGMTMQETLESSRAPVLIEDLPTCETPTLPASGDGF